MLLVVEVPRENRLQGNDREVAASPSPVRLEHVCNSNNKSWVEEKMPHLGGKPIEAGGVGDVGVHLHLWGRGIPPALQPSRHRRTAAGRINHQIRPELLPGLSHHACPPGSLRFHVSHQLGVHVWINCY